MQAFPQLLRLLNLLDTLHVDQSYIPVLDGLPLLVLVGLQNDLVFTVDHLGRVHFVVELVRVSQFSLQLQTLDDLVFVLEIARSALIVLALFQDAQVLAVRKLTTLLVHASG